MRADELAAEALVIRVEGVLDVRAAERIVETLADAGEGEVRIDLSKVREFHDSGVVRLARALDGRQRACVVGLRHHHVRLLRYLGIDAGGADLGAPAELA